MPPSPQPKACKLGSAVPDGSWLTRSRTALDRRLKRASMGLASSEAAWAVLVRPKADKARRKPTKPVLLLIFT
ncbi:unknown protein [Microcystis aeruginosa NIES-843]|uniref:Uncharacterized protein n=1 Tax=Microcystis aeruginosa (strain NIES-843 / IAM M-2473) TaxID=449447 RepID=B0JNM3_MICAN|nr:unknown protein [Microcystis aeruginosa NIES-843]